VRHDKGDRKTEAEERAGNDIWRSSDTLRVREESRGFEVFEISFARVIVMYFDDIGVVGLVISLLTHGNSRKHEGEWFYKLILHPNLYQRVLLYRQ